MENYVCSINESVGGSTTPPVHIEFEKFVSPTNRLTAYTSRFPRLSSHSSSEQLIVYSAPIIQTQLSSCYKETAARMKEIKTEKSSLLAIVNKTPAIKHPQQHDDQQQ